MIDRKHQNINFESMETAATWFQVNLLYNVCTPMGLEVSVGTSPDTCDARLFACCDSFWVNVLENFMMRRVRSRQCKEFETT